MARIGTQFVLYQLSPKISLFFLVESVQSLRYLPSCKEAKNRQGSGEISEQINELLYHQYRIQHEQHIMFWHISNTDGYLLTSLSRHLIPHFTVSQPFSSFYSFYHEKCSPQSQPASNHSASKSWGRPEVVGRCSLCIRHFLYRLLCLQREGRWEAGRGHFVLKRI